MKNIKKELELIKIDAEEPFVDAEDCDIIYLFNFNVKAKLIRLFQPKNSSRYKKMIEKYLLEDYKIIDEEEFNKIKSFLISKKYNKLN